MYEASTSHCRGNSRCTLNSHLCDIPFTRSSGGIKVIPRPRNVPIPKLAPGGSATPDGNGLNRLPQVAQAGARVRPLLSVGTMLVDCEKPVCCTPSMTNGAM